MKEKFYHQGLRFECTGCGGCCTHNDGYVDVTEAEAAAIAAFLGILEAEFIEQYLMLREDRAWELKSRENGDCIFLENKRCLIYPVRPRQCRTYPFWKENLKSSYRWKLTAQECPGIGIGKLYTREEIQRILVSGEKI